MSGETYTLHGALCQSCPGRLNDSTDDFDLISTGGTSAFSLTDGPPRSDIVRKYSDCQQADEAATCSACAGVSEAATIFVVLSFIFSVMSMVWSYYELFADTTEDSSNYQLLAILKKAANIIFSILALTKFRKCYEGFGKDDEIIEVTSHEYGLGVGFLITSVILTSCAAVLSTIVLRMRSGIDARVVAEERENANKVQHTHGGTDMPPESTAFAPDIFDTDELNCNHKRHTHDFDHDHHQQSAHHPGTHHTTHHAGYQSGEHTHHPVSQSEGTLDVVRVK